MTYNVSNNFVKFILVNNDVVDVEKLKIFLVNYIIINEVENDNISNDTLTVVLQDKKYLNMANKAIMIDGHISFFNNNELLIYIDRDNPEEIIFIKRLLIDLTNRLFEQKNGTFLHSSSIVESNNSIVFIGDKGTGKTTNMLNIIEKNKLGYSSNERTGIIHFNNEVMTYGNPARINIRPNTLKCNESLRKKLLECIDVSKYLEYSKLNLPMNCEERLVVTFDDISKKLDVDIVPFASLYSICNLIYNPNIDFKMEKVDYINMKDAIIRASIDGVFPQRQILNEILPIEKISYDDLLNSEQINYYNIYQNNTIDNSDSIIKVLRRD